MIELINIKAGDTVHCTGDSGFCDSSNEVVEKTTEQFDEHSGESYKVIWLEGGRKFDSRTGEAMNPPTAYYIIPTNQPTQVNKMDDNSPCSAFAFNVAEQIEQIITKRTNDLEEQNKFLQAKILEWYGKTHDQAFKEHFGIISYREGKTN